MKRGFTLIEILIASVVLTVGLLAILSLFAQSQRMMMSSARFETAQRVLNYFEMVHPIPAASQVTDDPLMNDLLNVEEVKAEELTDDLELDLSPQDRRDLSGYSCLRQVDDIDDEELARNGGIYTVRTTVRWGGNLRGMKPEEESVIRLWWNKEGATK